MSLTRVKQALAPLYAKLDPSSRAEQGERLAATARAWAEATDAGCDLELCEILGRCWLVREAVRGNVPARAKVEAALVERGWTPLKIRELVRALERLAERPATVEEQAVADADTYWSLGAVGLIRAVAAAAATPGRTLDDARAAARRALGRKVHLAAAQAPCKARRERLAALLRELDEETR